MLRSSAFGLVLASAAVSFGCAAVYPELKTPLNPVVNQAALDAPPKDVKWLQFKGATVPSRTRDGRQWDAIGGSAPDPYAILFVNGKVLLKTPVQSDTLTPTWPKGPRGNFRIEETDRLRVELWDSNPLNDHPIGVKDLAGDLMNPGDSGEIDVECESGAHVRLAMEPAHALFGLGFFYELRTNDAAFVTRTYEESPASRAGIKAGDEILKIGGRAVTQMKEGELQSALNTTHPGGLVLQLRHPDRSEVEIELKEGAVYPLASESTVLP
jgi:hypothetical protein